ncbi:MAG: P pilus assembly/Cpx signaling pathway, periplasmic inhibitor/zinc-resistance associated protein [Calothrix sp. MO_167.B42]|nr:P pilus assembly/Cpx signaling pathway, periplasmic inhibitor/zinc-resistance associated protein [Calothrix sp. MO_167.B42]
MQFTKISLIAGTIALTLVITPLTVKAETNISSPQIVAQIPQLPFLERLGLTESQKAQFAEIRQNTRAEIKNILTPQQQEQFQTITANMDRRMEAFRALNLSDEQKNQVWNILQSTKSQAREILTPEQRQKAQTLRQKWINNRPFVNR